MAALNFRRPLAFNVGEDGDDFLVGQHAVIDRHGVGIGLAEHTRARTPYLVTATR